MAAPQVASMISGQIGTSTSRAAQRALRFGALLSLVALGAGLMLTAEPAWAQARGANPPVSAVKKSGPTPVAVPPISAEPISARLIIRLEQVERQAAELAAVTGAVVSAIGGVAVLVLAQATKARLETSIRARERTFKPEAGVWLWVNVMAGSSMKGVFLRVEFKATRLERLRQGCGPTGV